MIRWQRNALVEKFIYFNHGESDIETDMLYFVSD